MAKKIDELGFKKSGAKLENCCKNKIMRVTLCDISEVNWMGKY